MTVQHVDPKSVFTVSGVMLQINFRLRAITVTNNVVIVIFRRQKCIYLSVVIRRREMYIYCTCIIFFIRWMKFIEINETYSFHHIIEHKCRFIYEK